MKIKVEKPKPEDVEGIFKVQKETWLATYPNEEAGITVEDIEEKDFFNPEKIKRYKKEILDNKNRQTWVAKDGASVIGFCGALKEYDMLRLSAIYVLPKYQGRGVGKMLMSEGLNWLGDCEVEVRVAKYNKQAIDFYKKFGFKEVSDVDRKELHSFPSGKLIPEILMIK